MAIEREINFALDCAAYPELLSIANDSRRHAHTDGHRREIPGDNRSGAHYCAISYGNTRGYDNVCAKPDVITDSDRRVPSRLIPDKVAPGDAVIGRDDGCTGAEEHVAPNCDRAGWRCPHRAEMI